MSAWASFQPCRREAASQEILQPCCVSVPSCKMGAEAAPESYKAVLQPRTRGSFWQSDLPFILYVFRQGTFQTFSKHSTLTPPSSFAGLGTLSAQAAFRSGPGRSREDAETHLEVGLCKAPCNSNHGGRQRARDPDGGQELRNVGREAERDWTVRVQVPSCIVYVESEVSHIQLACVLHFRGRHF